MKWLRITFYKKNKKKQLREIYFNEKDIEKIFVYLNLILNEIDLAVFYDNTYQFRRFAIVQKGKIVRLSSRVPKWFEKVDI